MVLTKDSFVEPRPRSSDGTVPSFATDGNRTSRLIVEPIGDRSTSICITAVGQPFLAVSSATSSQLLWRPKHRTFFLTLLFAFLGSYCFLPLVYRGTTHYWSSVVSVDIHHVPIDSNPHSGLEDVGDSRDTYRRFGVDTGGDGKVEVSDQVDDKWEPSTSTKRRVRFPRTKRRLPQCIIIGVRKCGTRALLEFLNIHPLIVKATQEVHFFDDDSRYSLGLEWYRRRMPYSFADQITVEKSPSYFVTRHVPERIAAMKRDARLLLIVREPVTRAVSDYAQIAANRAAKQATSSPPPPPSSLLQPPSSPPSSSSRSGRSSMKMQPSFEALAVHERSGDVNADYRALKISMYANYLQPWLNVFPRQQIHVIDGDRLVVDPLTELRLIEDFLELEHRISADNFYFNRTKGFYCVRNDTAEKCLSGAKGRPHPSVPAHIIDKLKRFFAPHNDRFFDMVGRNFSWTTNHGRVVNVEPSLSPSNSTSAINEVT